jgi:hypothetical protein
MNYYISKPGGEPCGPFDITQLRAMWAAGSITTDTLFYDEASATWLPIKPLVALEMAGGDVPPANKKHRIGAILCGGIICFFLLPIVIAAGLYARFSFEEKKEKHERDAAWKRVESMPKPVLKTEEENTHEAAYKAAVNLITHMLKAPATAQFSPVGKCKFSEKFRTVIDGKETDAITVSGWVDAQNSYGGLMRNQFKCSAYRLEDTDFWLPYDAELDD